MGKSGISLKKIAVTFRCTGTVTFFLHPVEGVYGGLGVVLNNNLVIYDSKSGNTGELTSNTKTF